MFPISQNPPGGFEKYIWKEGEDFEVCKESCLWDFDCFDGEYTVFTGAWYRNGVDCAVSGRFFDDECDTGGRKPKTSEASSQDLRGRMRAFIVFSDFVIYFSNLACSDAAFYVLQGEGHVVCRFAVCDSGGSSGILERHPAGISDLLPDWGEMADYWNYLRMDPDCKPDRAGTDHSPCIGRVQV